MAFFSLLNETKRRRDDRRFRQIEQIKGERGARIGRYIMASTTAKYSDPSNIFAVPCDVAFLAS